MMMIDQHTSARVGTIPIKIQSISSDMEYIGDLKLSNADM